MGFRPLQAVWRRVSIGGALRLAAVCAALAAPGTGRADLALWTRAHVSPGDCRSHMAPWGVEPFSRTIRGHKWPHETGFGIEFIDHTAAHLNALALGRGDPAKLRARLLAAARGSAFTRLDFEGPGGASPSFATAVVVKTVAYSVSALRDRNALRDADLAEIDAWVRRLNRNAKQKAHSEDHKAALIVSRMAWAAATGNATEFEKERRGYARFLGKLKRRPVFAADLRNNNEVMHQMVQGAFVLAQNGYDYFNWRPGTYSLNEAIAHHAGQVLENGDRAIRTAGDPSDRARSILKAQGWGTHLAWVPVFLAAQPRSEAAAPVRALDRTLRRTDRRPYWGIQMGVHTGCLFGP